MVFLFTSLEAVKQFMSTFREKVLSVIVVPLCNNCGITMLLNLNFDGLGWHYMRYFVEFLSKMMELPAHWMISYE